jgi:hypothetical protein
MGKRGSGKFEKPGHGSGSSPSAQGAPWIITRVRAGYVLKQRDVHPLELDTIFVLLGLADTLRFYERNMECTLTGGSIGTIVLPNRIYSWSSQTTRYRQVGLLELLF